MKLSPWRGVRASAAAVRATGGHPRRKAARLGALLQRLVVAFGATACALSFFSCTPGDGFQCGTPLPGDVNTIRECDAPHQACICATNSCAENVATTECETGFRYLDSPFANSDLRGKCVAAPPGDWLVKTGAGNVACRNEADGGAGGASSTSSTSSSSSGSGTSTGAGGGMPQ